MAKKIIKFRDTSFGDIYYCRDTRECLIKENPISYRYQPGLDPEILSKIINNPSDYIFQDMSMSNTQFIYTFHEAKKLANLKNPDSDDGKKTAKKLMKNINFAFDRFLGDNGNRTIFRIRRQAP